MPRGLRGPSDQGGGGGVWREHVEPTGGVAHAALPGAVRSRVFIACLPCARSQAREEKGRAPAEGGHFPWRGQGVRSRPGREGAWGVTGLLSGESLVGEEQPAPGP